MTMKIAASRIQHMIQGARAFQGFRGPHGEGAEGKQGELGPAVTHIPLGLRDNFKAVVGMP